MMSMLKQIVALLHRLAQQQMTLSDLEWPFHPHHALSRR